MTLTKALLTLAILAGGAFAHADATCTAKPDASFNAPTKQDAANKKTAEVFPAPGAPAPDVNSSKSAA